MTAEQWLIRPHTKVDLSAHDPDDTGAFEHEEDAADAMAADLEKLRDLQERLYVDDRHAILLVLQGMDTAGKDGAIKHLSGGLSLIGAEVTNFKAPTPNELQHDFLWRIHEHTPARGRVGIFNRSHYEDVLIVRVHNLVPKPVWQARYDQINAFEQILAQTGTTILKCFLSISKDEQKERLQARLDDPAKRWKLNPDDLKERERWADYIAAYEAVLTRCSTADAPWYVIPADHKWYRNFAVTRVLVEAMERLDLRLPKPAVDPKTLRIE